MQSAIWHSWEFGGWYRQVPYGTLGRERVNSIALPSEDCTSMEHWREPVTAGTKARRLQPLSVRVWWNAR